MKEWQQIYKVNTIWKRTTSGSMMIANIKYVVVNRITGKEVTCHLSNIGYANMLAEELYLKDIEAMERELLDC